MNYLELYRRSIPGLGFKGVACLHVSLNNGRTGNLQAGRSLSHQYPDGNSFKCANNAQITGITKPYWSTRRPDFVKQRFARFILSVLTKIHACQIVSLI